MDNVDRIPFADVLADLQAWSNEHSKDLFREKVIRIYVKALTSKRRDLALRIAKRYPKELSYRGGSDMAIAMALALYANQIVQKQKDSNERTTDR